MRARLRIRSMGAIAGALLSAVMLAFAPAAGAQTSPVVKTRTGAVQGVAERGVVAFKGIPYAAPPVGDLRWREPRPAAAWQGVRKAETYGNACMQPPGLSAKNGGDPGPLSEDCLYLNVWTPKPDASARLPVMVWLHGGAYTFGSAGLSLYNGAPLAKRGAVIVTLNYRLGQLGFFAHPALEKEHPGGVANFGLLDQITALQWVQHNIAQFGGDAKNVTIMGQSAGAKSVLALFASPLARGLFHKGIAQSSYAVPDNPRTKALDIGVRVAEALAVKGTKATAAQLRAVPAEKFAQLKGQGFSNAPVPISGDKVLPHPVQETFAARREARLPLIVGNTSDDASVVAAFGIDAAAMAKRLGAAGFFLRVLYPRVSSERERARQAARDVLFTMPVRWIADRHANRAPTWRYYFDYVAVRDRAVHPHGTPHGGDVPYALDTGDLLDETKHAFTDQDRQVARRVSDYWLAFARTGKPAAPGLSPWPDHRGWRDNTMLLGETASAKAHFMRTRLNRLMGASAILGRALGRK